MNETDWYERHDCQHAHCPLGCDKPQPAHGGDGELYCMRCWVEGGVRSVMIPCRPETCED